MTNTNRENLKLNGWKWVVTGYYNDTVKFPKTPGGLACEVVHKSDHGKDVEVDIFNNRDDIGTVTVERL